MWMTRGCLLFFDKFLISLSLISSWRQASRHLLNLWPEVPFLNRGSTCQKSKWTILKLYIGRLIGALLSIHVVNDKRMYYVLCWVLITNSSFNTRRSLLNVWPGISFFKLHNGRHMWALLSIHYANDKSSVEIARHRECLIRSLSYEQMEHLEITTKLHYRFHPWHSNHSN